MAAAYMTVKNGFQCAMMAPTEILAMQHYRDFCDLFSKLGIECGYLTGSTPAASKRKTLERLANGELKIVIGTHALLSDKVCFKDLGLVITDEQHRFGVQQRSALQDKGFYPHVLVMSATPIPRTLALILMGDLDISNVDELPPGRQKVDTLLVGEEHRERLNGFISKQVAEGRQVYIVCPSVEIKTDDGEEVSGNDIISFDFSDTDEPLPMIKSAVQYEQELRTKIFPNLKTAFIHGKMKGKEKDAIMKSFADGEIDILVSTTVIEVGVNVPNATLMIVENAERFGLSQLHQLRGRVGRGKHKSYCVLVSDATGANAKSRLEIMRSTSDGYAIAQKDLELRGPGDFIASSEGARQHGGGGFQLAGFCADSLLLDKVFKIANETVTNDSQLTDSEKERVISYANKQNGVGVLGLN
jgi:ATP-dependent DNA helicase RecG